MTGRIQFKNKTKELSLLSVQHSVTGVCTICIQYFCKPQECGQGIILASAIQPKGITIIFGVDILLPVHT